MPAASPSGPQGPRPWYATELGARFASAIVLGIVALLAAYRGGGLFALFWLLAGGAILYEWTTVARVRPTLPLQVAFGLALAGMTLVLVTDAPAAIGFGLFGLGCIAGAVVARDTRNRIWALAGFACAAVVTVVPPLVREHPELGITGLLWMFAVVWTTDVTAYFVGRKLGGPKLWPRVSPKKTWSGFAGGFLGGVGAGLLVAFVAQRLGWVPVASLPVVVLLSGIASLVSQAGDLAESALKRRFEVKDSSRLIPGHGGVMDRLDGFFAVALLVGAVLLGARIAAA
ncbi:phosphatidate cytidylyltransferase [Salinarimonas soli]|uniref:Phosphatidate cytidylyltransferase n=1 Tax=Salinarimonas soli TaxID=1638099 RepID=A0A5B2VFZ8_9HYPH|nr:phosphatidate cytidylyltransferase [Salinarimonas soli]KAA2237057.1 phosphatidate cytidylyltransferase [Salinarimonas soli]